MQLTGCTVKELKTHIENLFVDDKDGKITVILVRRSHYSV